MLVPRGCTRSVTGFEAMSECKYEAASQIFEWLPSAALTGALQACESVGHTGGYVGDGSQTGGLTNRRSN